MQNQGVLLEGQREDLVELVIRGSDVCLVIYFGLLTWITWKWISWFLDNLLVLNHLELVLYVDDV